MKESLRTDYEVESDYTGFHDVLVELRGPVAILTLNRPEKRNAANHSLMRDVTRFFITVRDDHRVRSIVVTGAGGVFCAGGDLAGLRQKASEATWLDRLPENRTPRLIASILAVEQPIVAAVSGGAIGWGASLALWSDIVIMGSDAVIGDPHVKMGLTVPQNILPFALAAGIPKAKALLLTGRLINGDEAAAMGLVDRSVPPDKVQSEALALANELAELPPLAVRWTKRCLNRMLRREVDVDIDLSVALEGLSLMTEDHLEALDSWLAKRKPKFSGK